MKKVKLGLIMALVVTSFSMAQQSVSMDDNKFEITSNTSEKTLVPILKSENRNKKNSDKVTIVNDIKMYPNPASDLVTLQGVKVDDVIMITDNKGKNRVQIKAKAEVEIIPIEFLESGTYFLSINGVKRRLLVE
ncbi:T9SS type A sorting domain-containing protein [Flavobacterium jejuense]|uniref:T9SS type A sorting domain-containing protein n=1 Tax=Flavobacterium jejuense TaxID=1544455 RepID=A0ABX0IT43_9FLAO|nr:T9SS type A sorting domain-containing protein [Flavobacterium jejuense]NHN25029.1 T9SS type A sorting domain-containing protein [Flavobacterium jejuense]